MSSVLWLLLWYWDPPPQNVIFPSAVILVVLPISGERVDALPSLPVSCLAPPFSSDMHARQSDAAPDGGRTQPIMAAGHHLRVCTCPA